MTNVHSKLLLACIIFSLIACDQPPEKVAAPRPALVLTIGGAGEINSMTIVGEVKSRYESVQGFRVTGKITDRKVEIGELVKKGQILAQLDSADYHFSQQVINADIVAAQAQLALAKTNLERQRKLLDQKFISAASLDRYESEYKIAAAQLNQARAQGSLTNNQSRYTALRADRSGIISMINAEPGQVVAVGEVIARIVDPSQLEVHIPIAESQINKLSYNGRSLMRLWAKKEKVYQVKLREVSPIADPSTRTFLAKLSILNIDQDVRIGMTAGVRLNDQAAHNLQVPTSAVIKRNNQTIVWIVDKENHVHPKVVQVERYHEENILLTQASLAIGDKVVVAGAQTLTNNQSVKPIERQ